MSKKEERKTMPKSDALATALADKGPVSGVSFPTNQEFDELSKKISIDLVRKFHQDHPGFYKFIQDDLHEKVEATNIGLTEKNVVEFIIRTLKEKAPSHPVDKLCDAYNNAKKAAKTKGKKIQKDSFRNICDTYFLIFCDNGKDCVTIHPCYWKKAFPKDHSLIIRNQFQELFGSKTTRVQFQVHIQFKGKDKSLPMSLQKSNDFMTHAV